MIFQELRVRWQQQHQDPEPDAQLREPGAGQWVKRVSSVLRLTESGLKGQEGPGQSKSMACWEYRVPSKGTGAEFYLRNPGLQME